MGFLITFVLRYENFECVQKLLSSLRAKYRNLSEKEKLHKNEPTTVSLDSYFEVALKTITLVRTNLEPLLATHLR